MAAVLDPVTEPEVSEEFAVLDPVTDLLRRARIELSDPNNWIRGKAEVIQRDGKGEHSRRCAIGMLMYLSKGYIMYNWQNEPLIRAAHDRLAAVVVGMNYAPRRWKNGHTPVTFYNDTHSHADILALFDQAIKQQEDAWAASQS